MNKYIIGAIGETSPYLTPRARAGIGTLRYLTAITDESRLEIRREILSASEEKIRAYLIKLGSAVAEAPYCVVAPTDKLSDSDLEVILEI